MKNNSSKYMLLLVAILFLVTLACGGSTTEQLEDAVAPSSTPEIDEQEEIPTETQEPEPEPTEEPIQTPVIETVSTDELPATTLVTIIGGNVNIRSGPGTEYPVIQTLGEGNTAPATGFNSGRSWTQIELPSGKIGWVGSDLAEIQNSDEIEIVTDIPLAPAADTSASQPAAPQPTAPQPTAQAEEDTSRGNTVDPFQCVGGCAEPPDPSCAIKGNVNSKGERIYHMPGGMFYNRTDITPGEGDLWFCTEAEAQNAGFRRSQR